MRGIVLWVSIDVSPQLSLRELLAMRRKSAMAQPYNTLSHDAQLSNTYFDSGGSLTSPVVASAST